LLNVDNCKCTQLYVTHYSFTKIDFRIFYTDSVVRKTIYAGPQYSQRNNVKVLLATESGDFAEPLDSIDREIISTINKLNKTDPNIIYKLKGKALKGYIPDRV